MANEQKASLTEETGMKIVEALRNLGGGGSPSDGDSKTNESLFYVIHVVDNYPGDGEDPYEGQYEQMPGAETANTAHTWLDATFGEIKQAMRNGKIVCIISSEVLDYIPIGERTGDDVSISAAISQLFIMPSYFYTSTENDVMALHFYNVPTTSNNVTVENMYAIKDSDYPCDAVMVDPDHPSQTDE